MEIVISDTNIFIDSFENAMITDIESAPLKFKRYDTEQIIP